MNKTCYITRVFEGGCETIFLWSGIALILLIGFIHVIDAPDSFNDALYKGWLFYANGAGALLAAYGIYRGKSRWGWNLGFMIAAGSFIGYVISRTVGFPFIPAEPDAWLEPLGVASLIAEWLFIAVFTIMKLLDKKRKGCLNRCSINKQTLPRD